MFKKQFMRRIASIFLAMTLLITFAVPSSAMGFDDLQTVIDVTGDASSSYTSDHSNEYSLSSSESDPEYENVSNSDSETAPASSISESSESATQTQTEENTPLGASGLSEEEMIKRMEEWARNLNFSRFGLFRAAAGDTGNVQATTIHINSYNVTVPGVGNAYGSIMLRMQISSLYGTIPMRRPCSLIQRESS